MKEVNEANEALKDPEKRAAYDQLGSDWKAGQEFEPPPELGCRLRVPGRAGGSGPFGGRCVRGRRGFDASDFFETLFGRRGPSGRRAPARQRRRRGPSRQGADRCRGRVPRRRAAPLAARAGRGPGRPARHCRSARSTSTSRRASGRGSTCACGPGQPGSGRATSGDLYLEIAFTPHSLFRVDGADVSVELPRAPWEAALGATVDVPTPEGTLQLTVPTGFAAGR